jgi:hypothetical protein
MGARNFFYKKMPKKMQKFFEKCLKKKKKKRYDGVGVVH